jgi:hypothetical protein
VAPLTRVVIRSAHAQYVSWWDTHATATVWSLWGTQTWRTQFAATSKRNVNNVAAVLSAFSFANNTKYNVGVPYLLVAFTSILVHHFEDVKSE